MKQIQLSILATSALFVSGLRDKFATANYSQEEEDILRSGQPSITIARQLAEAAGAPVEDVLRRFAAGLTPRQAVDAALQQKAEDEAAQN